MQAGSGQEEPIKANNIGTFLAVAHDARVAEQVVADCAIPANAAIDGLGHKIVTGVLVACHSKRLSPCADAARFPVC
jgi:hypothetical protein